MGISVIPLTGVREVLSADVVTPTGGSTSSLSSAVLSLNNALNPLPHAFFLLIAQSFSLWPVNIMIGCSVFRRAVFVEYLPCEVKVADGSFAFRVVDDHRQSETWRLT